jgi:hypothetical protein
MTPVVNPDAKPQKINLGFQGGPSLSVRVKPDEVTRLRAVLGGTGWFDLNTDDGAVALDLARLVFVMSDTEAHHVGFGA